MGKLWKTHELSMAIFSHISVRYMLNSQRVGPSAVDPAKDQELQGGYEASALEMLTGHVLIGLNIMGRPLQTLKENRSSKVNLWCIYE